MKSTLHHTSQPTLQPGPGMRAKCRNRIDAFEVDRTTMSDDVAAERTQDAKAICRACPIAADCLRYALAHRDQSKGIWAGTTGPERGALRRRLKNRLGPDWRSVITAAMTSEDPIR